MRAIKVSSCDVENGTREPEGAAWRQQERKQEAQENKKEADKRENESHKGFTLL